MKYGLPFPKGTIKYKIANPTGIFAHENFPETGYAIDFRLDLGTEVIAAREGTVLRLKKDSTKHFDPNKLTGMSIKEMKELAIKHTNYVCINHGDGTYAEYVHLGTKIPVEEGQEVQRGQLIGYVGLTGITSDPHLHFNVFEIVDGKVKSIPIEFEE